MRHRKGAALCDFTEGSVANSVCIVGVHVGTSLEERPHYVDILAFSGIMQRCLCALVETVRRMAFRQKFLDAPEVAGLRGEMERARIQF